MSNTADFGANDWLIEEMREQFVSDPSSVPEMWRTYFLNNPRSSDSGNDAAAPRADPPSSSKPADEPQPTPAAAKKTGQPNKPATESKPVNAAANKVVATVEEKVERSDAPNAPGAQSPLGPDVPNPHERPEIAPFEPTKTVMRGAAMRTAKNMEASLTVPTATSVRTVPMKLVIENRATINSFLKRSRGGKVSFTHIIAFAMIQAIKSLPLMNMAFENDENGKPVLVENHAINLGIAVDVVNKKGERQLLVPNIKDCGDLDFAQFWAAYEAVIRKSREGRLTVDDFANTTATITNPGGIGTNASVPRLMNGQSVILGVGSIDYAADFEGTSAFSLTQNAVSKVTTLTSTYDHRVIQGAVSGEFLKAIHRFLVGDGGFYEQIFESLRIPYPPTKWAKDIQVNREHEVSKHARVASLVNAYRLYGHLQADTDPLEYRMRSHPDLELENHGLTLWDLDREFPVKTLAGEHTFATLRQIIDVLRGSYSHTLSIEYMHIPDPEQRTWIQERVEKPHVSRPREDHLRILGKLSEAEVFETFLQTKYVGQTRFSMEGAESVIVILSQICEHAADQDLAEVCIGMPHRGRLNVLANITGKLYSQIFREFDNKIVDPADISGDVKYHLGAAGAYTAASGKSIATSVAANPSHLEAVNPVLEGITRAKNDVQPDPGAYSVLPLLMHGDASFAGQGIVYETLQMSQLRAYTTGGTIHLIVNNQIGFTTGPVDGHTSQHASDVAKAVQSPVIHVNGDDPDACAEAATLAFEYRQRFHKDIVIDMLCYRRRGHNEGDDPSFTQPLMYDLIEKKRPVRKIYTQSLIGRGDISMADAEESVNNFRARLEEVFSNVRNPDVPKEADPYRMIPEYPAKPRMPLLTAVTREDMAKVADVYSNLPDGFNVHPRVQPQLERRAKAIKEGPIDWATAELLAMGTLLMEGHRVRLAGQDSRRGTYSQRFGSVVDRVTNESWVPLKHLTADQAPFDIYDSFLSEYAAMGFEYGYSLASPGSLVCWEAQYGDFFNGAQTIVDEFVTSGYAKWTQKSGVVLLLPHGYEGAGPDHSSSRIERFLQACQGDNMAVCQPSTPASHFHLLRQHAQVNWHRPLIIATPKSMLRNKLAVSMPEDFVGDTNWRAALPDPSITDPSRVKRVLLCSGKVRWDLVKARKERELEGQVAIIPVERLFPLADQALSEILADYAHVSDFRWVQDEPENQGPWQFLARELQPVLSERLGREFSMTPVTRAPAVAPATGSHRVHAAEQSELMSAALD